MRSFAIQFGAILVMTALFVPALAAPAKPDPSDCKAAATMTEQAGTLATTLAETAYTAETKRE